MTLAKTALMQTKIGKIPEDWLVVKFGNLLQGTAKNGVYKPKEFHGSGTKIINMGELFGFRKIRQPPMERVRLDPNEQERFRVEDGDLLFARRSLVAEGAGKCSLVVGGGESRVFESSIIRARPDPAKVDSGFLFYLFNSSFGRYLMDTILRQVAVAGITGSDLVNLNVPLPSLREQQSIVKILSDLDSKIELNQQMNGTLESIAQAIFKHWFIDFEFPDENGNPYKSNGGEMIYNEEMRQEIPLGWAVIELGDVIKFEKGKRPREISLTQLEGYLPLILIETLNGGNAGYAKLTEMVKVSKGEPIMVMDGASSGRIELGYEGVLGSTLAKIQCKINTVSNFYIYQFLRAHQDDINQNTTGTSIPHADKRKIEKYHLALPGRKVIEKFDAITKGMTNKTVLNKNQSYLMSQVRDSILPKLLSGRIRVPEEKSCGE